MRKFLIYFLLFVISPVFGNAKVDYDVNNVSLRGDSTLMNMKITGSYFADGAFLIETTGSRYEYVPGELKVYQGLGSNKRLLATVTFDQKASFKKVVDENEQVLFWSEKLNAGICADSTCMLAVKTDVNFNVTGDFVPLQITESNPLLLADDTGSIGISNTANYTAKVTSSKLKNWSVSYTLKANQVLTFSVGNQNMATPVLVLPSCQKVLQDETSVTGNTHAEIFCAKNETESFQVLVANKSTAPLPDVHIDVAEWQAIVPGSKTPIITLFREHYVKVDKPSSDLKSKTGMYPDALIPFIDPYTNKPITKAKYLADHATVQPKTSQGYWIDIAVGPEIPAGSYATNLKVTSAGATIAQIPVLLHVWDFTLPKQRKFITWMYGFYNIYQYYGLQNPAREDYYTLEDRYRDMVYEHGIYPEFQLAGAHYTTQAKAGEEGKPAGTVTFSPLYHSNMKAFISKYGTGIIPIPTGWLLTGDEAPSEKSKPTKAAAKRTLQCYNDLSKAHPEHGQYVVYLDEPYSQSGKNAVKAVKDIMNEIPDLKLKMMLTGSQYAFDILDSAGNRCADLWVCYGQSIIDDHTHAPGTYRSLNGLASDFIDDSNRILWTHSPYGFTDASLLAYRDFAWYGYTLGMTGGFNWRATMPWTQGIDAWVESRTYTHPDAPDRIYNGAYFLIYPGNYDRVGISGIGGPIASMRLKTWRKACEDFEYFKMLEELTDKATVDAIVSNVVQGYYTCAAPEDYAAARKTIAELILKRLKNN